MENTVERILEITNPVWNSKDSSYMFEISGSSLILTIQSLGSSAAKNVPHPLPAQLESFLEQFIEKTSKHFATPLRTSTMLPRLTHKWNVPEDLAADEHYMFHYSIKAMIIKSKEFCLVWACYWKRCAPLITSDFLNLSAPSRSSSPARDLRTIQIQPSVTMDEHEVPMTLDSRLMTLEYENTPVSAEKKRVREARLRAALANLRADRLAEKYYQKYGTPAGDGSSDLSSESEDED